MVIDVAFSPDGRRIVSAGAEGTVKVWEAATGDVLKTFSGHGDFVESVAFSPDGGRIVSSSKDGTIRIWDTVIDRERVVLNPKDGGGRATFSPDGTRILSKRGGLRIWDIATGTRLVTLPGWSDFASVALSPDGKRIFSCSWGGKIRVWDAATAVELKEFPRPKGLASSISFSPGGERIVSYGLDYKTVKIWDAETGVELARFDHDSMIFSLAISPDGEKAITACLDKTVRIWKSATGAELMTLRGHEDIVTAVTFSPDGKRIVSGDIKGTIKWWDAASGKELASVQGHTLRLNSLAFSPDGKRIVSSGRDGTVKLWDAPTGAEVMILPGHDFASAKFSPDGKTLAIGTALLETETPPNGYGPRRTGAAARKLVDELYEKHGLFLKAIEELTGNKGFVEPVRKIALQIADARLWQDAEKLNQETTEVVSSPGKEIDEYKAALEKAQKANSLNPDTWSILTTLGIAHYRVGAYEEALETVSKSIEIIKNITVDGQQMLKPDPANQAFKAMSLHQLGRNDEAQVALAQLRLLCLTKRFLKDERAQAFLAEARSLMVKEGQWLESAETDNPQAQMVAAYEQWLRLSPDSVDAHSGLAWLLATCPVDEIRDGAKAIEHARKACELTDWENHADILAAAYAETGDFDSAVKYQKKAIEAEEHERWHPYMEELLKLYQSGKPYRSRR
jgi:WD40 repeat protein/tetratricopeptide (TPR) repeat protein